MTALRFKGWVQRTHRLDLSFPDEDLEKWNRKIRQRKHIGDLCVNCSECIMWLSGRGVSFRLHIMFELASIATRRNSKDWEVTSMYWIHHGQVTRDLSSILHSSNASYLIINYFKWSISSLLLIKWAEGAMIFRRSSGSDCTNFYRARGTHLLKMGSFLEESHL